jgi:hypothetical protein
MKTYTFCWLMFLVIYVLSAGCATRPDLIAVAETELLTVLSGRDANTMDLVKVGQTLIQKYGRVTAVAAVQKAWDDQSTSAPHARAKDMMWLQSQKPRVRDLAWLLNFQEEWVK